MARTAVHGSVPVEQEGSKPGSWFPKGGETPFASSLCGGG